MQRNFSWFENMQMCRALYENWVLQRNINLGLSVSSRAKRIASSEGTYRMPKGIYRVPKGHIESRRDISTYDLSSIYPLRGFDMPPAWAFGSICRSRGSICTLRVRDNSQFISSHGRYGSHPRSYPPRRRRSRFRRRRNEPCSRRICSFRRRCRRPPTRRSRTPR